MSTYYEILGVSQEADQEEIKKQYKKLALKFHPDKSSDPEAAHNFRAIAEAYGTLSDPYRRGHYDAELKYQKSPESPRPDDFEPFIPQTIDLSGAMKMFNEIHENMGFNNDFFNNLFAGNEFFANNNGFFNNFNNQGNFFQNASQNNFFGPNNPFQNNEFFTKNMPTGVEFFGQNVFHSNFPFGPGNSFSQNIQGGRVSQMGPNGSVYTQEVINENTNGQQKSRERSYQTKRDGTTTILSEDEEGDLPKLDPDDLEDIRRVKEFQKEKNRIKPRISKPKNKSKTKTKTKTKTKPRNKNKPKTKKRVPKYRLTTPKK